MTEPPTAGWHALTSKSLQIVVWLISGENPVAPSCVYNGTHHGSASADYRRLVVTTAWHQDLIKWHVPYLKIGLEFGEAVCCLLEEAHPIVSKRGGGNRRSGLAVKPLLHPVRP